MGFGVLGLGGLGSFRFGVWGLGLSAFSSSNLCKVEMFNLDECKRERRPRVRRILELESLNREGDFKPTMAGAPFELETDFERT